MAINEDAARSTINGFMQRAERIMATTAAQRHDLATIGTTLNIMLRVGERLQQIERSHLPVTELLEAAVMIRPVTLQRESIYIGNVVTAIGAVTLKSPESVRQLVKQVKKEWPKTLNGERWILMVANQNEPGETRLTDVEIAELWFNAHVWHNDQDKQHVLRYISEDECLICASVWVSDRVFVVRALQQLVVDLKSAGHI